ncbi:peptidylprolyl isomerase [Paenibacillus sp. UNC451MF]|uniref:peptidylprolyl isomerase n=1 Tax=Paenibacillus sp. UNC451MF TaxID=1449063 RepID=UPI0009DF56C9|nr:peptidylprolyl isomerase [Paenibacillus sp. UNC451MF]
MGQGFLAIFMIIAGIVHYASVGDAGVVTAIPEEVNVIEEKAVPNETVVDEQKKHKSYAQAPEMSIDVNKTYEATLHTNKGDFTIELFPKTAPLTVNNFVFLARDGFYEDVEFHRIIESFMIQTGDPTGTGMGGPGYKFADELKSPYKYEPGIVAMANAGPNTNGSQFFICTGKDSENLNQYPNYTIFGKITDGMDTVLKIAGTPVAESKYGEKSHPIESVKIQKIDIIEHNAE